MRYRCIECGTEAEIDFDRKTVKVRIPLPETSKFPSHPDCVLAKPVDEMDKTQLEEVN